MRSYICKSAIIEWSAETEYAKVSARNVCKSDANCVFYKRFPADNNSVNVTLRLISLRNFGRDKTQGL